MSILKEFANEVISAMKEYPGFKNAALEVVEMDKPGNLHLTGISIRKDDGAAGAVFYIDEDYEAGLLPEQTAAGIVGKMKDIKVPHTEKILKMTASFEEAKKHLFPRLMDIRNGKNDGYLKDKVCSVLPCGSIGVVYCLSLKEDDSAQKGEPFMGIPVTKAMCEQCMGIPVTKAMCEQWKVSIETLDQEARENGARIRPARIAGMEEMLPVPAESGLTILTNMNGMFGASAILYPGIKQKLDQAFPDGYYLLPSSIHEFIVIGTEMAQDLDYLLNMVKSINETEVAPEDQLADDVFMLDDAGNLVSAFQRAMA